MAPWKSTLTTLIAIAVKGCKRASYTIAATAILCGCASRGAFMPPAPPVATSPLPVAPALEAQALFAADLRSAAKSTATPRPTATVHTRTPSLAADVFILFPH